MTFSSPGIITCNPVSLRGPVSKQKSTQRLILYLVSPCGKMSVYWIVLREFLFTVDSTSVLVMQRPFIRKEPGESEKRWRAVEISGKNKSELSVNTNQIQSNVPFQQITTVPESNKWHFYSKLIIQRLGLEHFRSVEQIHWRRCLQIRHGHVCELSTALEQTEDNVGQRQLVSSPCLSRCLTLNHRIRLSQCIARYRTVIFLAQILI